MKLLITILLSLLCFDSLHGSELNNINEVLLNHAKSYSNRGGDLRTLHDYLIEVAENESQKAEIFFYWISQNIEYDVERFLSENYLQEENNILESQKGICEDYANLFKAFCDLSEIECHKIVGYAKGFSYDKTKDEGTDHAWNIVKVDGKYKFIDATWGSGYLNYSGNKLKYFRKIAMNEVLVNSNYFRTNRLPGDPKWQLLEKPISFNRFISNENFEKMHINHNFEFNFNDSIAVFNNLDPFDKLTSEWKNICNFHPVSSNYYDAGLVYLQVATNLATIEPFDNEGVLRAKRIYQMGQEYLKIGLSKSNDKQTEFETALQNARQGIVYCNYRIVNRK